MSADRRVRIQIVSTGSELASGRSRDTNAPYIAQALTEHGYECAGFATLPDDPAELVRGLRHWAESPGVQCIIMTGGLGPTEDDHTVDVLAELTGSSVSYDPDGLRKIEVLARRWKRRYDPEAARRQVRVLDEAISLPNQGGMAPGIFGSVVKADGSACYLAAMPGVPQEMEAMLTDQLLPVLLEKLPPPKVYRRVFYIYGVGESNFQTQFFGRRPRGHSGALPVERGELPADFVWGITSARGHIKVFFESGSEQALDELVNLARTAFADHYVTGNARDMLHELCLREEHRIATAESCTGGMVGKILTERSGSSAFYLGGAVAYSNAIKTARLGVPASLLEEYGAVSAQTARAMARGACEVFLADYAVSITGIAGPGGGNADKPVGTVYIACAGKDRETQHRKLYLPLDRDRVREYSANMAVFFLYRFIAGELRPQPDAGA